MTIATLRESYGEKFEGLFREDKALIASVLLYYISLGKDKPEYLDSILGVSLCMNRFIHKESNEVGEFLTEINQGFSDSELLDICRALI